MNKYTIEQSGRSMIEMLGVLAIVGVLSVAGIAGYSKAMGKYKANKVIDQVSMTAANVRTAFAGQGSFRGLTAGVAFQLGVLPDEVSKACTLNGVVDYKDKCLKNAFGGGFSVAVSADDPYVFNLGINRLTKEACSTLVASDWGSASTFVGISSLENVQDEALDDKLLSQLAEPYVSVEALTNKTATVVIDFCRYCEATGSTYGLVFKFK